MPGYIVALAGLALVAALIALGAGWARLGDHERRIANLEKHGGARRATVEITEDLTDTLLQLAEDESVMHARMDNLLTKIEFIRHTGKINAPWSEIINWKNGRQST